MQLVLPFLLTFLHLLLCTLRFKAIFTWERIILLYPERDNI